MRRLETMKSKVVATTISGVLLAMLTGGFAWAHYIDTTVTEHKIELRVVGTKLNSIEEKLDRLDEKLDITNRYLRRKEPHE